MASDFDLPKPLDISINQSLFCVTVDVFLRSNREKEYFPAFNPGLQSLPFELGDADITRIDNAMQDGFEDGTASPLKRRWDQGGGQGQSKRRRLVEKVVEKLQYREE